MVLLSSSGSQVLTESSCRTTFLSLDLIFPPPANCSIAPSLAACSFLSISTTSNGFQGQIQRLQKGGHIYMNWELVWRTQCRVVCVCRACSIVRGCGGLLPRGKLDHMRVLLRPSETTITTQSLWQLERNSGDSSICRLSEPLPFGISLCI